MRLLGSASVPAGKLVRPVMVAFSFRGIATSAGSTSLLLALSELPELPEPPPQALSIVMVRISTSASARALTEVLRNFFMNRLSFHDLFF